MSKSKLRMPQEMASARARVTARVENTQVGVCPVCKNRMPVVMANNIECYYCERDSIVLPTQDK